MSDKAFESGKTVYHNQKVLQQKKPELEASVKYADAPFVDVDEAKKLADVREKLAKNADKPTTASGDKGEKDLPNVIKQVDPQGTAQVIPQIYQKMSQMRGILSFGGGMGGSGGGSGSGAGSGATDGYNGAGASYTLQDSFTGALAILTKKYNFERVISIFVKTLEGDNINYIDEAYRKYVTNGIANLIKLALYFGPLNIPVSQYDDTVFGDLVPDIVVLADGVPDMYVKQYYTLSEDPYPGYIEWLSPDGKEKVYVKKEPNSYHYTSCAQEVFSISELLIAKYLDPYFNPRQIPVETLTATILNDILAEQMYLIEENTANNSMGNNSNNNQNSGNMMGGMLQQLMSTVMQQLQSDSVLNSGEIQQVLEKNKKTMGVNNQLFDIAKGALQGGSPLGSLGNMGGLSNIMGGFMSGGGGLNGVLGGAGLGNLIGGFGGFGGNSGGGGGGAGSGFSVTPNETYNGGNVSSEGMKDIEQMLRLLGIQ